MYDRIAVNLKEEAQLCLGDQQSMVIVMTGIFMCEYRFLRVLLCLQTENTRRYRSGGKRRASCSPFRTPCVLKCFGHHCWEWWTIVWLQYIGVSIPRCAIILSSFLVLCFSELLQDLENCENDPVAIADCFVSKVSGYCRSLQHNTTCRVTWGNKIN